MMERVALSAGRCGSECVEYSVSAFIMVVSMGISFVGLTNVVKYGYGYCGYLGIAIIIVPLLTVGFYKNRKFMKENSQDAKVSFEEVYEEN